MIVRMKTTLAGPDGNAQPGQVITVSEETGRQLVAGGYAEIVQTQPPAVETAAVEPPETAVTRKTGRKRG